MASWNKMCRACLIIKESFTYVLSENVSPDLYYFCTSIEILQDNLPKTLCDLCYENLMKHSEFKRICLESQNALYSLNSVKDHDTASLILDSNVEDDHQQKCEEVSDPITVKTEKVSNGYDYIYTVKSEDIDNGFYDSMDFSGNSFETNSKKAKKRKAKKLGKHKGKEKQKPRKRFSFTCETCNKKFNYLERFEAHKLEHQGKEPIINCLSCNKTFMTWSGLRRHNDSEHTIMRLDKLKCKICGKICKSQQTLKMHQKIHEERKMYVCDVCGKGFTTKFILKAHLETHKENRERLFTCQHCGKKFYTNTILLSHISRSHTDRRFICQICSYPFTEKYNLVKHLLIHDGKKVYKCEICKKSYATQSSLVEHRRIHSGERPYICSYCPKSFLSKRRLDDHHKTHTGERPHKCVVCEQGFTQRGTLKRHMKVHDRSMTILGI